MILRKSLTSAWIKSKLEQGDDVLEWWFSKEDNMIDEIDHLLSSFPYAGKMVEQGLFKGLRCLTHG